MLWSDEIEFSFLAYVTQHPNPDIILVKRGGGSIMLVGSFGGDLKMPGGKKNMNTETNNAKEFNLLARHKLLDLP